MSRSCSICSASRADRSRRATTTRRAAAGYRPDWLRPEVSPFVGEDEWPALARSRAARSPGERGPRHPARRCLSQFEGAEPTPLSPWGIRLPADSRVDDHPAFNAGLVEVQDEGSQLIALACEPATASKSSTCAPEQAESRWRSRLRRRRARILATDSNRERLSKLDPRAERAGAQIETRLLNPPQELDELADWRGAADVVLVDAPCSGSGTWRRNPEGAVAADARAARPRRRAPAAAARHRRRAGEARRPARLCRLLASVPRRGRADRALP